MVMSRDQIAGRRHNTKIDKSSSERVEQLKYLGKTLMNHSSIQEEIESRLKPGNVCCHSAPNLLFSSLLSKNIKIKIHRAIILLVVLCGCETWSLILREVFKNRELRRIFGPKKEEVTREWRKLYNEELNDIYSSLNIIWVSTARRMRWVGHVTCMGEKTQHSMEWHHVTPLKN